MIKDRKEKEILPDEEILSDEKVLHDLVDIDFPPAELIREGEGIGERRRSFSDIEDIHPEGKDRKKKK